MTVRAWPYAEATVGTYDETFQRTYINELWGSFPGLYPDYGVRRGLGLTTTAGLNVVVGTGAALINGHLVHNDAAATIAISANSSGNARIDLIVARIRTADSPNFGSLAVVNGTPSATPSAPSLVQTGTEWQIPLAEVYVANGAVALDDVTFKDVRKPMNPFEARENPIGIMKPFPLYSSLSPDQPGDFNGEYECFLFADGRYIGNGWLGAGSELARDNYDTWHLYNFLWNITDDTYFPIVSQFGGAASRGASATADWFENKFLPLPDTRGRVIVSPDNLGGTAAGRLTSATFDNLGGAAGAETHTLTTAEMPVHNHGVVTGLSGAGALQFAGAGASGTAATVNAGSGNAHNNVQPTIAIPFVIKFKHGGH
jgi:microcystin-dependent protein